MRYFLILWLVLFMPFTWAQSQQVKEVCGVLMASCPSEINLRISGGGSTCAEHAPWNAIVVNINAPPVQPGFKGLRVWCGGVLVTQRHVVSAAHCYWKNKDELGGVCPKEFANATAEDCRTIECPRECIRVGRGELTLYFGITNRQEPGFGLVRSVKRIDIHPGWDRGAKLNNILEGHDIAILTINTKLDLSLPNIQPVCLPYTYTQEVGFAAQVAGFGVLVSPRNGQKTYPSVIQSATVFVDSKEDCVKQWKIRGNQICARGKIPKPFPGDESFEIVADSCDGDSGGGLTAATGPDNRTVLYGITSFGERDCGRVEGKSGVYTNVYDHMNWITPIISDKEGICGPDESCYSFNDTACSQLVKSFRSGVIFIADLKEKTCSTNPSKFCCKIPETFDDIKFKVVGGSSSSFASSSGSIANIITRRPLIGGSSSSTQRSAAVKTTVVLLGGDYILGDWYGKTESYPCDMPLGDIELGGLGAAVLNGQIVYCGGKDRSGGTHSNCYKNEGRDWIEFESLNVARHLFTLTTLGDKILAAGGAKGGDTTDTVEVFDGSSWKLQNYKLTSARSGHCAVPISVNQVILIGGYTYTWLSLVEKYSIDEGFIAELPSMPTPRWGLGCSMFKGEIWTVGGHSAGETDVVEVLTLGFTNTWRSGPKLTRGRKFLTMEVLDNSLVVFGGAGALDSLEKFDGEKWTEETLQNDHFWHASVSIPCN